MNIVNGKVLRTSIEPFIAESEEVVMEIIKYCLNLKYQFKLKSRPTSQTNVHGTSCHAEITNLIISSQTHPLLKFSSDFFFKKSMQKSKI